MTNKELKEFALKQLVLNKWSKTYLDLKEPNLTEDQWYSLLAQLSDWEDKNQEWINKIAEKGYINILNIALTKGIKPDIIGLQLVIKEDQLEVLKWMEENINFDLSLVKNYLKCSNKKIWNWYYFEKDVKLNYKEFDEYASNDCDNDELKRLYLKNFGKPKDRDIDHFIRNDYSSLIKFLVLNWNFNLNRFQIYNILNRASSEKLIYFFIERFDTIPDDDYQIKRFIKNHWTNLLMFIFSKSEPKESWIDFIEEKGNFNLLKFIYKKWKMVPTSIKSSYAGEGFVKWLLEEGFNVNKYKYPEIISDIISKAIREGDYNFLEKINWKHILGEHFIEALETKNIKVIRAIVLSSDIIGSMFVKNLLDLRDPIINQNLRDRGMI